VKIVETAGNKAIEFWPKLKAAGISIIHKCGSPSRIDRRAPWGRYREHRWLRVRRASG
jgi:hypothetical protein